jgi:hypothetical protein
MAKNNQKKEKALRNKENARKYRKKPAFGRSRGGGGGNRASGSAPAQVPAE